ncbi:MAG: DUF4349 domain-containing protein [Oscillibacter sp.]|nr:DUF4349 domain-containing protein [Oscillibacter sp.]
MKRRWFAILAALALVCTLLTACGSSAKMETAASAPAEAPMAQASGSAMMDMAEAEEVYYASTAMQEDGGKAAADGSKRIYTANIELETTEFDQAAKSLTALMEESGGWYESSSMGSRGSGYRYASYTVRIPVEHYRNFLDQAGELCLLTYSEEYVEDVSEHYYDTQGRLKTQQIKLERLQSLLAKAELMEDIITIESAISETEQLIDDLSGTLQHYDARVAYSTIHVNLREVARLSNVEEPVVGFGAQFAAALSNGWKNFVDGMQDFAIGLAYSWMWVLALIAVVVVVVRTLKGKRLRLFRRKKNQTENTKE